MTERQKLDLKLWNWLGRSNRSKHIRYYYLKLMELKNATKP